MRSNIYYLLVLAMVAFASCEKVIDAKLNTADRKYVIEGVLTDQANSCKVVITQTRNFDENNTFPGISGALVTVAEGAGAEITLSETASGIYENNAIVGVSGRTYKLKVIINGETFTASSTVPAKVNMDSMFIRENTFINDKLNLLNINFVDPVGRGNSYRFLQYINGVKDKSIFIRDDDLIDGRSVNTQLFSTNDDDDDDAGPSKIKSGDIVKGEMLCIDPSVYKYWYSLDVSATGESQSASPANPVTNIKGGALGYFSAHTYQTKTITAP